MVSFPYYSHIFRDSYGSGMGIVWEAYHKGVPCPSLKNPTDSRIPVTTKIIVLLAGGTLRAYPPGN